MAARAAVPESELPADQIGIDAVGCHALGGIGTDVCPAAACAGHSQPDSLTVIMYVIIIITDGVDGVDGVYSVQY